MVDDIKRADYARKKAQAEWQIKKARDKAQRQLKNNSSKAGFSAKTVLKFLLGK